MFITEESQRILQNSPYPEKLKALVDYTKALVSQENIQPTDLQWTILINHLNEMIVREKQHETIPAVDPAMFAEVSATALSIAEKIVEKTGDLPLDEMYVLSIHFESAKQNSF